MDEYAPSDELFEMFLKSLLGDDRMLSMRNDVRAAYRSAIAAIAPALIAEGMERAAKVAEGFDGATNSKRNVKFFEAGLLADVHDRDFAIAAAIRALYEGRA